METACSWLCDTLDSGGVYPLQVVYERHIKRSDSFDLSDVLSFLPERHLSKLIDLITRQLTPTLSYLKTECPENKSDTNNGHMFTVRAASEMAWLLVSQRNTALLTLRPLVFDLHDAFLDLPSDCQDRVSAVCEILWHAGDAERNRVVPCTMLYFLQRSFGEESVLRCSKDRGRLPGTVVDIHRVYVMRKALETLELAETSPQSETIRNLLMRCTTSYAYLKTAEGRKFLAYLLTLNDVKASIFDALTNHLATVRKSSANLFGAVFLYAWKSKREEWLAQRLMYLSEKAIQAGAEPFSTNLRVVLSNFHANKRVTGVDLLLNEIYSPVLFRNLMVANPLVRRNAVIVLSDAFPIHDPGAGVQEIERTIEYQCSKLLALLQDPCCTVRLAAIEGSCRVLGLFWELVSSSHAKRVVDLLTSQMAFDTSSSRIRVTVFEGLKFLVENHLSHQVLAVALPRLGSVVHERVERVRLSFLDLLLAVKRKRMVSLRYFDVVEIHELLLRLPKESPAVAAKIMELIRTSYFPLERRQKTAEELATSQTRACLSLLDSNREAAQYFYKHLYLHVAPGPLLEFAMRLSYIALKAPRRPAIAAVKSRKARQKNSKTNGSNKTVPQECSPFSGLDENVPPLNDNQEKSTGREYCSNASPNNSAEQELVLRTVSEVLVSISSSLRKEANKELQTYLDDIFRGEALRPLLLENRNSLPSRAACWRIASCLSLSQVESLTALWQKQMCSVSELHTCRSSELPDQRDLVSALLLCGLKWNLLSSLSTVFVSWCDASVNGSRATVAGMKAAKRTRQRRNELNSDDLRCGANAKHDAFIRAKFLFSLWFCGDVILTSEDLHEGFLKMTMTSGQDQELRDNFFVLAPLRKACVGALDFFLESSSASCERTEIDALTRPRFLLRALTTTWRLCLKFAVCDPDGQRALQEMRQLTIWFSSSHLWKSAFSINDRFATALASICLAHCADTAAVIQVTSEDVIGYEAILKGIRSEMVYSDTREGDQLIAEALRLSFLLREQSLDTEICSSVADPCRPLQLRNTSNALLSMACEVLSNVKLDSDRSRTTPSKAIRHEKFLRDIIIDLSSAKDMEDFQLSFSKSLTVGFKTESMAEDGLFSTVVCNIVASLVTGKQKSGPDLGFALYRSIVRCLRYLDDRTTADQCIGNFTKVLVDSMFAQYNDYDDHMKLSDGARECFAKMSSMLEKEFRQLNTGQEQEGSSDLMVREALNVMVLLRNRGERDAFEDNEESAGPVGSAIGAAKGASTEDK